jgi:hypothetical protein
LIQSSTSTRGSLTYCALWRHSDIPRSDFCADENPVQYNINVIVRAPHFLLLQEALFRRCIEIFDGSKARDLKVAFDERDLCIRMREKIVDQILTVEFELISNAMFVVQQRGFKIASGTAAALSASALKKPRREMLRPSCSFEIGMVYTAADGTECGTS